jgi:hypothetical protein
MLDFDNHVYLAVFKTTFVDVVILLAAIFKMKSSAKYRNGINYAKKKHIKNVFRATHDLVISQP